MRVLTLKGAVRLGVLLLAYAFGFGSFQIGSLTTTGAQTVPKSLEKAAPTRRSGSRGTTGRSASPADSCLAPT